MEQEQAEALCEYHADNKLPLYTFLALQTQWRVTAGMAGAFYQGLEYASIPVVADGLRVPAARRPALFHELRVMEGAALKILNAKPDDADG